MILSAYSCVSLWHQKQFCFRVIMFIYLFLFKFSFSTCNIDILSSPETSQQLKICHLHVIQSRDSHEDNLHTEVLSPVQTHISKCHSHLNNYRLQCCQCRGFVQELHIYTHLSKRDWLSVATSDSPLGDKVIRSSRGENQE